MAYSSIVKPSSYFNTKLYTGNLSTNNITGVGFQPDLVWLKSRTQGTTGYNGNHYWFDAVRGATKWIISNQTGAEANNASSLSSFDSDGFTLGGLDFINNNGDNFVGWNWKANGAGSANTDGSINTISTSVNTTAGFSISQWTGTEANATIGHGLGVAPSMIIIKNTEKATSWTVYHKSLGATKALYLESSGAPSTHVAFFNNTEPTSSVFTVGTNDGANGNGEKNIAYCFAEKKGFSKFGSYAGNGNADGTFVYTGFKPAFVMVKRTNNTGHWQLVDNKRPGYNVNSNYLRANKSDAEFTDIPFDIVSNGFKTRSTDTSYNGSGDSYIYMAFAENPLVANSGTDGVPATAR